MKIRALIDVPAHELKAGEYYDLEDEIATALIESGQADPNAPWPTTENESVEPSENAMMPKSKPRK